VRISGRYSIPVNELMELTPAELAIFVEERERTQHDTIVLVSWLTAAFTRAKRLPKIDKFLNKPSARKIDPKKAKEDFEELKRRLGGAKWQN